MNATDTAGIGELISLKAFEPIFSDFHFRSLNFAHEFCTIQNFMHLYEMLQCIEHAFSFCVCVCIVQPPFFNIKQQQQYYY